MRKLTLYYKKFDILTFVLYCITNCHYYRPNNLQNSSNVLGTFRAAIKSV